MKNYYFKYIVTGSIEIEFNNKKDALKHASKIGELVYLTIFNKRNIYNEPYSDVEITYKTKNIKELKNNLVEIFNELT